MNPFMISHTITTSYNKEINPWCLGESNYYDVGTEWNPVCVDQEQLRETIANDCWDYEDSQHSEFYYS